MFLYSNIGGYAVYKLVNGEILALQSWTQINAINNAGWNELRVVAQGTNLAYYINDQLVWSGSDSTHTKGRVGIVFYPDTLTGQKLLADWATLTELNGSVYVGEMPARLNKQAEKHHIGNPYISGEKR